MLCFSVQNRTSKVSEAAGARCRRVVILLAEATHGDPEVLSLQISWQAEYLGRKPLK